MNTPPFYPFIIFFLGIIVGLIISGIRDWLDQELPVRREIKRRMNQPRPRAK